MNRQSVRIGWWALLCMAGLLVCPAQSFAGTDIWNGNAGDGLWSNRDNWSSGVPTSSDDVLIPEINGSTNTVVLDMSTTVHNLTIEGITLEVSGGHCLSFAGLDNHGLIFMKAGAGATACLIMDGNVKVSGGGTITSNGLNNYVFGANSSSVFTNIDNSILGGSFAVKVVNGPKGIIEATTAAPVSFTIDTGITVENMGEFKVGPKALMALEGPGELTNLSDGILSNGAWIIAGELELNHLNGDPTDLIFGLRNAKFTLDGSSARVESNGVNALATLDSVAAGATFSVIGDASLTTRGSLTNLGTTIVESSTLHLGGPLYGFGEETENEGIITVPAGDSFFLSDHTDYGSGEYRGNLDLGNATAPDRFTVGKSATQPGNVKVTGKVTLSPLDTVDVVISGPDAEEHSALSVASDFVLAGHLILTFADGYMPKRGTTFTIGSAGQIEYTFDDVTTNRPDLTVILHYDPKEVTGSVK